MARDFARSFYKSAAWEAARDACRRRARGLCQRCLARGVVTPGDIVHHKVHLTPENIGDPSVSLSQDNLELLCRDCHAQEHPEVYGRPMPRERRYSFDADGNVVPPEGGSRD